METIKNGKLVSISYLIRNTAGEIVEYSDLPVNYIHGSSNDLFDSIEDALEGRVAGEEVTVSLSSDQAFGPHDPTLTFTDDIENVPSEVRYVDAELDAENASGNVLRLRVTKIGNGKITIDANPALAGMDLEFVVTVNSVRTPTEQEFAEHLIH
ncbi:MAG: FKBP-type peptidyl-prolyl cis-trans isomerase [bacterium]